MTWIQNYTPLLDSLLASTRVAALPIVVLLVFFQTYSFPGIVPGGVSIP